MRRVGWILTLVLHGVGPPTSATSQEAVAVLPSGKEILLEIADTPAERSLGLGFREQIGPRRGMLFVFEQAERHAIWMKNCRMSLDVLWLDETLRITNIAIALPPCPEAGDCPSVVPLRPARYVIEVAAGTAEAEGLRLGDPVLLLPKPTTP